MVDATEQQAAASPSKPWLERIRDARDRERNWRHDVKMVLKRYRLRAEDGSTYNRGKFNILWSNTEVMRQAIYNQPPRPDVRQRWEQRDPLSLAVAELLNRGLTYQLDMPDFQPFAERATLDLLLTGRVVMRVRYEPDIEGMEVRGERLRFEGVPWDDFCHAPARHWERVEWCAFRHYMDRNEFEDLFPEFDADKISFSGDSDAADNDDRFQRSDDNDEESRKLKRAVFWEVWDKRGNKVLWVTDGCEDVILEMDPPLALENFYPVVRPLLAIEDPDSIIPQPLYMQYQEQAAELDVVSSRISDMVQAIKWRGLYDATLGDDLARSVKEATDGDLIPTQNAAALLERGGLEKAIFLMPIAEAVGVVNQLYQAREQTKQCIYEITGISDVLRGVSNPDETATAQQIKAQWGGGRVQNLGRRLQWYLADVCRLGAEVMAEHFSRETWSAMTGMNFPTAQEQQQAQMQGQQAQQFLQMAKQAGQQQGQQGQQLQQRMQQAQQMAKKAEATMEKPSWEDVENVLRSDRLRSFRVAIETDSTLSPDQQAEMKELNESMNALGGVVKALTEAVKGGMLSGEGAKGIVQAVVRKLPMQNEMLPVVENEMQDPMRKKMEAMGKEMQEMKMALKSKQQENQLKQQEMQLNAQQAQAEQQVNMAELQLKAQEIAQRPQMEAMKAHQAQAMAAQRATQRGVPA